MPHRDPRPLLGALALPGTLALLAACTADEVGALRQGLAAICTVEVIKNGTSLGVKDVEKDYLPNVVNCESGDLHFEALKAQAVASRTYVYYKLASGGTQITSGTSVQVYDCARKIYLAQKHYDAVNATAGQILTYMGSPIWPCFNAGVSPTLPPCTPKTGVGADTCCTSNAGKSGSTITQSPCGYVDPKNYKNRGCMCQNGSHCYAQLGKGYLEIIKAYFGDDIGFVTVSGSCIKPVEGGTSRDSRVTRDGKVDRGPASFDGTAAGDGAAAVDGPAVDGEDAGCSCAVPGSVAPGGGLGLLVVTLIALISGRPRRRPARRLPALALVLLVLCASGCSDDAGGPVDTARGPDAVDFGSSDARSEGAGKDGAPHDGRTLDGTHRDGAVDAAALTPCGNTSCTTATQICMGKTPVGPATIYSCQPVPTGCASNRTCACVGSALCTGRFNVCTNATAPNTVLCECPTCQ